MEHGLLQPLFIGHGAANTIQVENCEGCCCSCYLQPRPRAHLHAYVYPRPWACLPAPFHPYAPAVRAYFFAN